MRALAVALVSEGHLDKPNLAQPALAQATLAIRTERPLIETSFEPGHAQILSNQPRISRLVPFALVWGNELGSCGSAPARAIRPPVAPCRSNLGPPGGL